MIDSLNSMVALTEALEQQLADATVDRAVLKKLALDLRALVERLSGEHREQTSQAVRAERMVSLATLAQGILSELESPLGVVHQNLRSVLEQIDRETARIGGPGPLPRRVADQIRDEIGETFMSVDRLMRLSQDLRRLVPGEAGKVRVDLNMLVETALNLTRHRFGANVEIRTDYAMLPDISCYPDRLVQAFANLLVNSAEAIRGSGELAVRTRRRPGQAVIELSDTGVGIPSDDIPRIFDPFFSTKRGSEAVGLGLAIVREVVAEHDGQIQVESPPGEGTYFEIVLPLG